MSEHSDSDLLGRITTVPGVFGGKPVIRGRRLAVEHVLGMLAAGDDPSTILSGYPWLDLDDIRACLHFQCQQWMDNESDHYREWEMDVEEGELRGRDTDEDDDVDLEWTGSVEPNYDAEEERLTTTTSIDRRMIGYV